MQLDAQATNRNWESKAKLTEDSQVRVTTLAPARVTGNEAVADRVAEAARKLGDPQARMTEGQRGQGSDQPPSQKVGTLVPPCPHERPTKQTHEKMTWGLKVHGYYNYKHQY